MLFSKRRVDPFFLYLRSFKGEYSTKERWAEGVVGPPKVALAHLLESAGPLQEVGGDALGLGRARPRSEFWRESAVPRIIHSTAIFISPGITYSIQEEMDLILRSDRISRRTFLFMEPTHETMANSVHAADREAARDRRVRWTHSRHFFDSRGLSLPDYRDEGALISLYSPEISMKFSGISRYKLFDFLNGFYVDLKKLGSYDIEAEENCPCGSGFVFSVCHGRGRF